ncbi:MAG: cell division protein ZapA [Candidatus Babeliaceae bacterium]|nr:cell division protein ZapA [Candidatus Babeliaceae bacterium]
MNSPLRKYKVSLFGEVYDLVSDESEGLILNSASMVDSLMKNIAQQSRCTDTKRLALLVALHLAQQQLSDQSKLLSLIDDELKLESSLS